MKHNMDENIAFAGKQLCGIVNVKVDGKIGRKLT